MDAVATIIFVSGKTHSLFEGSYHLPCTCVLLSTRTRQVKASGWSILFCQHCAQVARLQDGVDFIFGGEPHCYPRTWEQPQQACCVCEEGWRDCWPRTRHRMSLLYSGYFHAAVHTMSSHLEVSSPHPWQLWMLLSPVHIRGRLLFCFALNEVQCQFATKGSAASIQVNGTGTIYLLVWVDNEYRYGCPMCTGTGVW